MTSCIIHVHVHGHDTFAILKDNTGWAAARNIFGKDIHHILCRWHIERCVNMVHVSYIVNSPV